MPKVATIIRKMLLEAGRKMDMPDYVMIGKRIRTCRNSMNKSQEALAEMAGIGIQHLSKIENGTTKLSLPCLIALANSLQTTVDNLLKDSIIASRLSVVEDADSVFSDCTHAEIYVLSQTVSTMKKSMRAKGLSDKK
jgi:transcriptional regulator with XRE-family HTH domain